MEKNSTFSIDKETQANKNIRSKRNFNQELLGHIKEKRNSYLEAMKMQEVDKHKQEQFLKKKIIIIIGLLKR